MKLAALNRVGRLLAWAALLSTLLLCTSPAFAEGLRDQLAQSLKVEGDGAMGESRFSDALAAYERAAGIETSPILDYNRARALQALGRNADAIPLLERFESEAEPELRARIPELDTLLSAVRSRVGTVQLHCNVLGARIRVDGRLLATTQVSDPLRLDVGSREVSVEADGYVTTKKLVVVPPAGSIDISLRLEKIERASMVQITSDVAGARVSLDGAFVGQVPIELKVAPGTHRLRIEQAGYELNESQFVARPNEQRQLRINLRPTAPLYARWWFWTGVGAVATAVTLTLIALETEGSPDSGDIPPGRLAAPLVRF